MKFSGNIQAGKRKLNY